MYLGLLHIDKNELESGGLAESEPLLTPIKKASTLCIQMQCNDATAPCYGGTACGAPRLAVSEPEISSGSVPTTIPIIQNSPPIIAQPETSVPVVTPPIIQNSPPIIAQPETSIPVFTPVETSVPKPQKIDERNIACLRVQCDNPRMPCYGGNSCGQKMERLAVSLPGGSGETKKVQPVTAIAAKKSASKLWIPAVGLLSLLLLQ